MIYQWGSRAFPAPAQEVGEVVQTLVAENGGVMPPDALWQRAMTEPGSSLYKLFTWDKDTAARNWWRQESRVIVNHLMVVQSEGDEPAPAFFHVRVIALEGVSEGYAPICDVIENDDMREQALAEALASLHGFRRRYQHLQALSPVFEAIDQLVLEPVEV